MPDQMPPARRRPSTPGTGQAGAKAPSRRTGAQRAVPGAAPPAAVQAKLVCIAGPKAGTEFPLSGDEEIVVGRATENAVSIPDTSVSRRHCSLRRVAASWAISDLGSGNGTQLNGEQVEGETPLQNADVVTIGDTELTFVDTQNITDRQPLPVRRRTGVEAPVRRSSPGRPDVRARLSRPGAPAASPRKKWLTLLAASLAVALLGGGLVAAKVVTDKKGKLAAQAQREQQARRQELSALFQDGKNLVRDGNWTLARARFLELLEQAPGYPGVQDYLERANIEIPNQEHFDGAEQALAQGQLAAAAQALGRVSRDTQQLDKLRQVRASMDAKMSERVREAAQLMNAVGDRGKRKEAYTRAQQIAKDVLAVNPEHRDGLLLSQNATLQLELLDRPDTPRVGPAPKPWAPVVARYLDGDVTGALAMADECAPKDRKCAGKAKEIRDFTSLYRKVEELDVRGLQRLVQLDRSIGDGQRSKMGAVAGTRAATAFYKNAAAAKVANQWGKAMEWARRALQADPDHAPSKAIVQEASSKAKEVYMMGYQLEPTSPDDAALKYREVLVMTVPGDEYHDKAKSRLSRIER